MKLMEIFWSSFNHINIAAVLCSLTVVVFSWWAWKILDWAWFRPKKLEKFLTQQGLNGNPYRLVFGDTIEMSMLLQDAMSKPMLHLTNDIIPRIMPLFYQTLKQRGKNSFAWLGPSPAVILSDPEQVKEVLTKHSTYRKPWGNPLTRLLALGLLSLEEDKWAKHRKIINPAFHVEKLKLMAPALYTSCIEMLSKWEEVASKTNGSCELDVLPYLQTMTSDVISRTAFGSNYEQGRKIFELQAEQADHFAQVLQRLYLPGWSYLPTKRNKRMKKIHKEVRSLVLGIITKRIKKIEAGEAHQNDDLLGTLLESNLGEIQRGGDKKNGISLEDMIEECKIFYIAGQETTSNLIVWTLIALSQHFDWQALARDEVLKAFGDNKPDIDGLNRLKIVGMILNEVLRLYPPAAMLPRITHKDTKLKDLFLPAGVTVIASPILLHHDEEIWGDDAKEFKPERFREGVGNATKGQLSFLPFSCGPRICIGQNLAMLEAKMAITLILQRFSFQLSPTYAHAPQIIFTLQPQYGAPLILRKL